MPDTTEVRINPETNTLMREGVASVINPFDMYAIEEALRIKESLGEGELQSSAWILPGGSLSERGFKHGGGQELFIVRSGIRRRR